MDESSLLEPKPDFLSFRQDMVAEQFTVMDAVSAAQGAFICLLLIFSNEIKMVGRLVKSNITFYIHFHSTFLNVPSSD